MQLTAFVDAGGTLVDTADVYCDGESERLLGALLADVVPRGGPVVATKAVRPRPRPADGPRRLPRAPAAPPSTPRCERLGRRPRRPLAAARVDDGVRRSRRRWPLSTSPSPAAGPATSACQQLHRLADRAGRDLAAGLARAARRWSSHAGGVLAAAARHRARGRAGRGGARRRHAPLVAAGPRACSPASTGTARPADSRGRLAACARVRRRPSLGDGRPDRRGGRHRRRGTRRRRRWRSRWPGCATGPAWSPRSSAPARRAAGGARWTPTACGCRPRSATRWTTSPAPPFAYPERRSDR